MIGARIMDWLRRLRTPPDARRQLDEAMAGTLAAAREASEAAGELQVSARRDRVRTRLVARKASRRAAIASERGASRQPVVIEGGVETIVTGMLGEVNRGKATDGRH